MAHLVSRAAPLGALVFSLLASCTTSSFSSPGGEDATGRATLAIAVVPPDVTCVQITAVGNRTVQESFPVTPNGSAVLSVTALPVGSVAFSGNAYSLDSTGTASCMGLTASTTPTWFSNTVVANVTSTSSVALTLTMTQNGQGTVTVDFPDGGGPAFLDSGIDATTPLADAGAPDAAAALAVNITSPSATTYVSSQTLPVQVSATGGVPSTVDLLVDGSVVATIGSPFQYSLGTSSLAVGTHALVAQGHFGPTTVQSASVSIVVDRTPPTIASHTPANGATIVHVADPILVKFSKAILASTVSGSAVTLTYNGQSVGYSTSLSPDGLTLAITPSQPTDGGGSFALTLTSSITDLAGNALSSGPLSWSWTSPQWLSYGAPTIPTITSTTTISSSAPLSIGADWSMGSSTNFEFDATAYTSAGATLPTVLFTGNGATWNAVAQPTFPTPPAGWTSSGPGYYLDSTNGFALTAYQYFSITTPPAGTFTTLLQDLSVYSGGTWSAFAMPANEDPNYGFFQTDAAGNGYHAFCPLNAGECDIYKRTAGVWSLLTKLTVPTTSRSRAAYTGNGTFLVFNYPWSTTTTVSGSLSLSRFDGTAWTTLIIAPNPINATVRTWYQFALDSSNNPYIGFGSCTTNTGAACPVYLMTPNAGAWQLVGGGQLPAQIYDFDAQSVTYAFSFDRFGRLSADLDGFIGASGAIQPVVVDFRGGAWQAPINVPVPTAPASTADVGFGVVQSASDFAGNPGWVETHATVDSTGLKATATAAVHLLNR
jgi:hypothetical protein